LRLILSVSASFSLLLPCSVRLILGPDWRGRLERAAQPKAPRLINGDDMNAFPPLIWKGHDLEIGDIVG
jgi:hypothetical protein